MAWDPTKPAGGDAANTIDNSCTDNFAALDTWASGITNGVSAGAAAIVQMFRAANAVIARFRAAAGDTVDRFSVDLNGKLDWGGGAAAQDVSLERTAANVLRLGAGDFLRAQADPSNAEDLARKAYVDALGSGADSPFRIFRGRIDTTGSGTILQGVGFSIVRNGTGDVTITFSPALSGILSGVATGEHATDHREARIKAVPTTTTLRVQVRGLANAGTIDETHQDVDGIFHFTAIGPR